MQLSLNLLQYQDRLQLTAKQGVAYLQCLSRKKTLVLTPEEVVRQLMLHYLIEEKKYPKNKIRVEMGLVVNNMNKRCDILVFNQQLEPVLLIECKSAKVKVSQKTFEQIARYNSTLKVPYLLVTNGPHNYCSWIDQKNRTYSFLADIPNYEELQQAEGVAAYKAF
jgi:signal recognition particle subunit SEC65